MRIYPGFIVASLISALLVGPLGARSVGSYFAQFDWPGFFKGMALLKPPLTPPVFQGQPSAAVNGAIWTIEYEFRCYLIVALLGLCGIAKRRGLWIGLSIVVLGLVLSPVPLRHIRGLWHLTPLMGRSESFLGYLSCFFSGGCFYLFRDKIPLKPQWVLAAFLAMLPGLVGVKTSFFVFPTLGAYVLFWFAFVPLPILQRFGTRADISYGVYLYGWPVQKLLLWHVPALTPTALFVLACLLCFACGWLSWHFIERPFMRLKARATETGAASLGRLPENA